MRCPAAAPAAASLPPSGRPTHSPSSAPHLLHLPVEFHVPSAQVGPDGLAGVLQGVCTCMGGGSHGCTWQGCMLPPPHRRARNQTAGLGGASVVATARGLGRQGQRAARQAQGPHLQVLPHGAVVPPRRRIHKGRTLRVSTPQQHLPLQQRPRYRVRARGQGAIRCLCCQQLHLQALLRSCKRAPRVCVCDVRKANCFWHSFHTPSPRSAPPPGTAHHGNGLASDQLQVPGDGSIAEQ